MTLEDRLIFLISKVGQKLIANLQKAFSENGLEATPVQIGLLFFLQKNDGSSLTQISQGLMLENPTVTALIDRLEKSGYVKRSDHPNDRRVYLIHITAKSRQVANKALPIVKKLNEQIKEGYSKEEIETAPPPPVTKTSALTTYPTISASFANPYAPNAEPVD